MEDSTIRLERLRTAIDYLKKTGKVHKQQDIADALGMTKGRISEALKGNTGKFTDGFLHRFAAAYKGYISEDWLLTGQGRMDKPAADERPHIDSVAASAGYLDGYSEPVANAAYRRPSDFIPSYDYTMYAIGDSMEPEIHSGDLLFCRRLDRVVSDDIGHILIVDTTDGVLVKRLVALSVEGDTCCADNTECSENILTFHSLNPAYSDLTTPASALHTLAVVVAVLHTSL